MSTAPVRLVLAFVLLLPACKKQETGGGKRASLAPGVEARVGADRIETALVIKIAKESQIPHAEARSRLVFDALFAAGARESFGPLVVHHAEATARARVLLEALRDQARAAGPPTDAEVEGATAARWWELDRPTLRRTVHAVVVVDKPEQEKPAHALAEKIALAVAPATDSESFRRLAALVPASGLTVKVEDLDPVAADGRTVNPRSLPPPGARTASYSLAFAAATFAIPRPNVPSAVARTEFGFHVILVTEILPEYRVSLEERRSLLGPAIYEHRAAELERTTLARARTVDAVEVERASLDLTEKVHVNP